MHCTGETPSHLQRIIKPPYQKAEIEFLGEYILSGLRKLRDVGKYINYEDMCDDILNLPKTISAPEWKSYWNYWKMRFSEKQGRRDRNKIFKECIVDACNKGLLSQNNSLIGLTGNFSEKVGAIIAYSQSKNNP